MTRVMMLMAAGAVALAATGSSALAKGCNGHVEPWRWGCAAWDNNNGPNFPYYQRTAPRQSPSTESVFTRSISVPATSVRRYSVGSIVVINGVSYKLISQDGATARLVSQGGGN